VEISLQKIIEIVTEEVIKELIKKGIKIDESFIRKTEHKNNNNKSFEIDMRRFKTPIVTENILGSIDKNINKIIVPAKTIITPGARHIVKKNKLTIIYKS